MDITTIIQLITTFFKIGLFSFGGGYAMIPLMAKEIEGHAWLTAQEFADIIAIAEMTPGPIAVNSATFTGYQTVGIIGGLAATFGVALPSFIIATIVSHFFIQFQHHPLVQNAFYGIRPVVTGLIAAAAVAIAQTSIFTGALTPQLFIGIFAHPLQYIDVKSLFIFAGSLATLIWWKKLHPILLLAIAGLVGAIIF